MEKKKFVDILVLAGVLVVGISLFLIFRTNRTNKFKNQVQNIVNTSNISKNWNTYNDRPMNYSFKYPETLSYEVISGGELVFFNKINSDYTSCNEGDKPKDYAVMGGPGISCLKKADFIYHGAVISDQSNMNDIKNELIHKYGYTPGTFKDNKGRIWDIRFKLSSNGDPLMYNAIILRDNGKYNSVQFTSYKDDGNNVELLKEMLSTVVFEN